MPKALVAGSPRLRDTAAKLDLLRALGPREAWRHRRSEARVKRQARRRLESVYGAIWREAAQEVGAEVHELGGGLLELRRGDATTRVLHHQTQLDDVVTLTLSREKPLVLRLLADAGLPVPEHVVAGLEELGRALVFVRAGPGPAVVKPASGGYGGAGATSGIETRGQLRRAALRASRTGGELLIERQVPGDVHRLLILDGELLDVVRRQAPRVTGDGRSTIGELVAAENRRRLDAGEQGLRLLGLDLDLLFTLERQGLALRTVLPAGASCQVKTVTNQSGTADSVTLGSDVSPELVADACRAASVVGVRLAGVDVITPDATRPLREAGGAIIEVNASPGLHHHYHVANSAPTSRVAIAVLRRLLEDPAAAR
jgi:cyanophycin synthetase